jgi:hypothetical protein
MVTRDSNRGESGRSTGDTSIVEIAERERRKRPYWWTKPSAVCAPMAGT